MNMVDQRRGGGNGLGPFNVNDFISLTDPSAIRTALKLLEAQATLIQSVHAELKGRLPPAHLRLPPEILTDIFAYLAFGDSVFRSFPNDRFGHRLRLAFTHVCQRWRQVALSSPILWSEPELYKPALAMMYLTRSGNIPLVLNVDLPDMTKHPTRNDAVANALEQWPRIRSLTLSCSLDALAIRFGPNIFQNRSIIEHLEIRLGSGAQLDHYEFTGAAFSSAPALRSLCLRNCEVAWGTLNLPNLTKLVVIHSEPIGETSWSDFVQALKGLPCLVTLEIELHLEPWTPLEAPRIVAHLSQLARLSITGCQYELCGVMQQVTFPSECRVRFSSSIQEPWGMIHDEDGELRPALQAYMTHRELEQRPSTPLRALAIGYSNAETNMHEAPRASFAFSAAPDTEPTLHLTLSSTVQVNALWSGGTAAWAQHIEVLALGGCIGYLSQYVADIFEGLASLTSVHTLHLRDGAFRSSVQRLGANGTDEESELRRLFPALQTLVIASVALQEWDSYPDTADGEPGRKVLSDSMERLLQILIRRAELGWPLGELRFENCDKYVDMGTNFRDALAACVGKLTGWGASKGPESVASRNAQ